MSEIKKTTQSENKSESALREERILDFWKNSNVFEKSLAKVSPKGEFIFYEGPPTANGKPGIHHLEARAFKDAIPRYKTMRGYHVRRKGGWDTHGLPVELEVEKKLGLQSKKEIEKYGIEAFNKQCKESVWMYKDLWEKFTERMGYFIDLKDPYITYENDYIESVWNIIKGIDQKKLLYKDYKVVPWCPRCGTALSSHELGQPDSYKNVKDLSVYVKFKIVGKDNIYFLAWTTTPWTLPGNVALAINPDMVYVKIFVQDAFLILAESRLQAFGGGYGIIERIKGTELVGIEYEPLYPFLNDNLPAEQKENLSKAYKVYPADFVTAEDGTGIVHTAVMYGQDDFVLGTKYGLPKYHLVNDDGTFKGETGFLAGRHVREEETAVEIIKDLAGRNLLFKKEKYEHPYPHCWRCKTALIYYARDSWYIAMSKLRGELARENEKVNWEPEHIKEGRFGEWIREAKDWAISRERYWGTPLPIWTCGECGERHTVGSVSDLKEKIKKSGNSYFVMRHGEAGNNINPLYLKELQYTASLTEEGKNQVKENIKNFKGNVDVVISSPLLRAKETTEIVCEHIGFPIENVIYDDRVKEWVVSSKFEGKDRSIFKQYYDHDYIHTPKEVFPDGESFAQLVQRVGGFLYDMDLKYSNKNIFIVAHAGMARAFSFVVQGLQLENLVENVDKIIYPHNAQILDFSFAPIPHNENYELDLHRPFIDETKLLCSCGGEMVRAKEVMDVWLDSGAMPFAEDHYPFENNGFQPKKGFLKKQKGYPADFISEAIDQTRGWFYTLLAVGVLTGAGTPFKNVICLGHLLDAKGQKMSKSVGNVVDPWNMMDKYGADTLRLWMYSVNQPGESKNFDEKTVLELHRQVFGLLYNVLAFYELYPMSLEDTQKAKLYPTISQNILDLWILARLNEVVKGATLNLDNYKLLEPVRAIRDFINDLSTWYLRRSRDRIKEGDSEAKQTLYFILKTLAKLLAPFAPFTAEDIWQRLKGESDAESVHLALWPEVGVEEHSNILENMRVTREIVSLGLEARQKAGIKVRQPLKQLKVKKGKLADEYVDLIKDEVNVKEVLFGEKIENEAELDINITPNLKEEGDYRELVRSIQDMRKKQGLTPSDVITLSIQTDESGKKLVEQFKADFKKTVLASSISFSPNDGEEIKVDNLLFKVKF